MKQAFHHIIHALGFDLRRTGKPKAPPRSRELHRYHTKTGTYYLPTDAPQDVIIQAIIRDTIFEQEIVDLASVYIRPGTAVLDVGANFGQMSLLFSAMVGEQGTVHSFEADPWVYEILKKNICENNRTGTIIPHPGAVYNVDNRDLIFPEPDFDEIDSYGTNAIDPHATEGRAVRSLTIDSLDIRDPVSFMKIDVQGCDLPAMQGAEQTIRKNHMPIVFEYESHLEERSGLCFQDYVDFVDRIGYVFHRVINQNYLIIPRPEE